MSSLETLDSDVTQRSACAIRRDSNNYRGAFGLRGAFWGLWCTKVSLKPESSPVADTGVTWYFRRDERARVSGHRAGRGAPELALAQRDEAEVTSENGETRGNLRLPGQNGRRSLWAGTTRQFPGASCGGGWPGAPRARYRPRSSSPPRGLLSGWPDRPRP